MIKDFLHSHEVHAIAEAHFGHLTGPPTKGKLPYKDSDNYDPHIRGWTKYWNEIFRPETPLDPDLIKALIGSESGFRVRAPSQNAGTAGKAHGLIQLTDQSIAILKNPNGELKDHLVQISLEEANDPTVAICAGIRWLFYKHDRASAKLGRMATWAEALADYKGYLDDIISERNPYPTGMNTFYHDLEKLKK